MAYRTFSPYLCYLHTCAIAALLKLIADSQDEYTRRRAAQVYSRPYQCVHNSSGCIDNAEGRI